MAVTERMNELYAVMSSLGYRVPDPRSVTAALCSGCRIEINDDHKRLFAGMTVDDSEVVVIGHSSARALWSCLRDRSCFDSLVFFSLENICFESDRISHRLETYLKIKMGYDQ